MGEGGREGAGEVAAFNADGEEGEHSTLPPSRDVPNHSGGESELLCIVEDAKRVPIKKSTLLKFPRMDQIQAL